jgi:hypothetical protein
MFKRWLVALLALSLPAHAAGPPDAPPPGVVAPSVDPTGIEAAVFDAFLGRFPGHTTEALLGALPAPGFAPPPAFDLGKVKDFEKIAEPWQVKGARRDALAQQGFVAFSSTRRHTMASLYYAIYAQDHPVLITTDSILHALHTAFDHALMELEERVFAPVLASVLTDARAVVAKGPNSPAAADAELYLTVALDLLALSPGASYEEVPPFKREAMRWGKVETLRAILGRIEAQAPSVIELYRGTREVDWSQFTPRGHYTHSEGLQNYFKAMMWLGRPDTGFHLLNPPSGTQGDPAHEREVATRIVWALKKSGGDVRLRQLDALMTFLVGESDNLGVDALAGLLKQVGVRKPADLNEKTDAALREQLVATGLARQRIRSQFIQAPREGGPEVEPPALFQLFGQRFLIDSFVLSKVVFDSIPGNPKPERMMPMGLDVMAALGGDEALRLLRPELEKWSYSANMAALRALIEAIPKATWQASLYARWLDALRLLHARPEGRAVPRAMQTQAWAHKQLRTQLGSWAELRHDVVLYGKPSYTSIPLCEYPAGFVEPYPAFYRALADLTSALAKHLDRTPLQMENTQVFMWQAAHFERMKKHLLRLAAIADRELAGEPLTEEDTAWLKKTIDKRGGGSGPPRYDGWYAELFYGVRPEKWAPTVADVHTDPDGNRVLEVAVGDAWPLVIVIDSEGDQRAYVGPTFSYYEWAEPDGKRLTDEEWQARIEADQLPPIPAWMGSFTTK